jgi:hyperosmotically inducible periplasmic protein
LIPVAVPVLALAGGGCASTRTQKSFAETVDHRAITAKVKAVLITNPETQARGITVNTRRGVVQLNGFVESDNGHSEAAAITHIVAGVHSVDNNLALKELESSAGTTG